MKHKVLTLLGKTSRHHLPVVAFAILGVLVVLLLIYTGLVNDQVERSEIIATTNEAEMVFEGPFLSPSAPVHVSIPSVGIEADFEGGLGLNDDQTIEVPDSYEELGWYKYGPTPGEIGPAVILGHVDSYEGPAVFYTLGQAKVGDEIVVTREDGTAARFVVTKLSRHERADFPTREVYGDIDHAGLRLITCTGVYDHGSLTYSHNLIVYARLIE